MTVSREEWLGLLWQLEGGKGEPRGNDRKRLLRRLRTLGRRQPKVASQDHMDRWLETVFHNAKRPAVRERLKEVQLGRRYAYMPKPWKGRKGRELIRKAATTTKRGDAQAVEIRKLHADGLCDEEVAARLEISVKTVGRRLKGHRKRKRTWTPISRHFQNPQ